MSPVPAFSTHVGFENFHSMESMLARLQHTELEQMKLPGSTNEETPPACAHVAGLASAEHQVRISALEYEYSYLNTVDGLGLRLDF